jgi:hypothetical protein
MLEMSFKFDLGTDAFEKRNPYDLILKRCSNWKISKRRILIVMQSVDARDLAAGEMMSDRTVNSSVRNALKYARTLARPYLKNRTLPDAAYAVVNFNAFKHLHLPPIQRREAELVFADRVLKMIKKLKPTHVLFCGDEAMHACFPLIDFPQYKRGWVHKLKINDLNLQVTSTLDFMRLLEKDGAQANLLGFWCRHLAYLQLGKNPHDLSSLKAQPRYVDTIEKFDQLMRRFDSAERCAIDTETKNLSVLHNKIYTIQFCTNHNESVGYVLPIDHPLCHWTSAQRRYIKIELRKRFKAETGPLLITFNGPYDLRVIRQELKIPIIWLRVWEIMYGEHDLDENAHALNAVSFMIDKSTGKPSKFGGLAPIYCSYGNDHYYKAVFSKAERETTGSTPPTDKGFLEYAATDVVSITGIYHQQLARANVATIAGKNFKKYFERHMLYQMSDTAHQLSHLRQDGSKVERKYLKHMLGSESPLRAELKRSAKELSVHKEVKQANAELVRQSGFRAGSLFGTKVLPWMFKFTRSEHKQKLFLEILGLEALTKTKTGAPQLDKKFVAHYKDKNKIISLYGDLQGMSKLMSTYVKGWYKKMSTNLDAATNDHLNPDYYVIDTGRLASRGPSLQQIPARGKLAKLIKRMFVASKGYLMIRYDYSAHEVRVWSIASGDMVLAEAFRAGQELRKAFIQDPSDENRKAIKEKGDIHILNVLRFFGKLVDKNHPLREAVKKVVFGVLYGKGAETLGVDTKEGDLVNLKSKIGAIYDESLLATTSNKRMLEINKQLEALDVQLTALIEEDRTEYAQGIVDKMFSEFKAGARWTETMQSLAENEYYVYSPIGRIRHLYAAMTQDRKIVGRQVRRGSNAPVQGLASEIGVKASRITMEDYYRNLRIFKEKLGIVKKDWDLRVFFSRMVHDANYFMVPYELAIPFIHIMQYQATYGVTKAYKDEFNVTFTVEPEIEMEVSARDDQSYKMDWSLPDAVSKIKQAVSDADDLGILEGSQSAVLKMIFKPWRSRDMRSWLQDNYPLLGVTNLDEQIKSAVKDISPYVKPKPESVKEKAAA